MANELKHLLVTSVDLVDQGANPDAHICLFKRREPEIELETNQETEEISSMEICKIDKSKLTPEELDMLAELEKKYGVPEESGSGDDSNKTEQPSHLEGENEENRLEKMAGKSELHPEVQKALSDFQELTKRQNAEVEALKKSLEIERLTTFAKRYEVLGKDTSELAGKLYELKKAGGMVYDDYVALLDENVAMLEKSGLFQEIGKNTEGSVGVEEMLHLKAAELAKSTAGKLGGPEAMIRAWEDNPDLAAQYEAEYRGER